MEKVFRILSIVVCIGATAGGYDAWADDSRVVDVSSKKEYEKAVSGSGMTVVMFKAAWCGACKQASPEFDALSNEMSDVTFVRADIDKVRNVEGIQVRAIPTFRYYRDGVLLKKENIGATANFAEQMASSIEQARQEAGEDPVAKVVEKAPEAQAPVSAVLTKGPVFMFDVDNVSSRWYPKGLVHKKKQLAHIGGLLLTRDLSNPEMVIPTIKKKTKINAALKFLFERNFECAAVQFVFELAASKPKSYAQLLDLVNSIKKPIPGTAQVMRDLHEAGVKVIIASNMGILLFNDLRTRDGFDFFNDAVDHENSQHVYPDGIVEGKCKPNAQFMEDFFARNPQLNRDDVYLVDDKLVNVQMADRSGAHGIRFKNPKQLRKDAKEILKRYQIYFPD